MNTIMDLKVVKKDGTKEAFNPDKVINAVSKSAARVMVDFSDEQKAQIVDHIVQGIINRKLTEVDIPTMHNLVEGALSEIDERVAKSYRDYRNYKQDFIHMMDDVYTRSQTIRYIGDKDNANTDSALVATKRSLIFNELNKQLYQKFFLTPDELQANKDGYIYIHDQSARLDTWNCCLANVSDVMSGGFEMGNVWYNEPKSLDTAFDVMGDVILSTAAQQYGGFTVPEVDTILEPYAEKSYVKYRKEFLVNALDLLEGNAEDASDESLESLSEDIKAKAEAYALKKVRRDFEQGFQGIEYKLNTVGSSRGDYPFITFSFGLGTGRFAKMANIVMMEVHMKGQGKKGFERPVLFPKYVFLYDENLHGPGKPCEDVFEASIKCSAKTMYPDYLSLTGEGYVPSMYKKYRKAVSPMGCVDGMEVITYRFHDVLYAESFERMWRRISAEYAPVGQKGPDDFNLVIPLNEADVSIYDTKKGFVKVNYLIRNIQSNWCDVTVSNGKTLRVTTDHPFETENRGVVYAGNLKTSDKIAVSMSNHHDEDLDAAWYVCTVTNVTMFDTMQYSYDVTTESGHFEVSGVYSHNCRAFLSPWYERGGMEAADENDKPVFIGRCNLGVVSLHLPMILAKAREEDRDFYEVLDEYMELIRGLHKRTYDYLGELHASVNPIMFCEGGLLGGHLDPHEKIRSLLPPMTMSFGITALNEMQELYNGKSLVEDNQFSLEVMKHINEKLAEFKAEDHILYAVYGSPAESLCYLQVKQFRSKYGVVKNVSDREYVSNSFHCHVTEQISPIKKQDRENDFWNYFNGGKIQYVRYPLGYNVEAVRTLVRRAMRMGFYEGVNLSLSYCDDCGFQAVDLGDVCPVCGSRNLTKIDRMNGYLAYSRRRGDTRMNKGKMAEIADRVSM